MKSSPEWSLGGSARQGWPWTCDEAIPDIGKRPSFSVSAVILASEWSIALEGTLRAILWQAGTGTEVWIPMTLQGRWPSCVRTFKTGSLTAERLNAVTTQSKSTWFTWLRPGDWWLPDTLTNASRLVEECPNADIISGRLLLVPSVGTQPHPLAPDASAMDGSPTVADEHTGWPPAAFLRRERVLTNGGFDPAFDWLTACEWHWRRMASGNPGAWVTTPAILAKATLPHRQTTPGMTGFESERERLWAKVGFEMPLVFQTFVKGQKRAA